MKDLFELITDYSKVEEYKIRKDKDLSEEDELKRLWYFLSHRLLIDEFNKAENDVLLTEEIKRFVQIILLIIKVSDLRNHKLKEAIEFSLDFILKNNLTDSNNIDIFNISQIPLNEFEEFVKTIKDPLDDHEL